MSLLGSYVDTKPHPELLTYGDLPHTVDCTVRANHDDPAGHYLDDTPDYHGPPSRRDKRATVSLYLSFSDCIRRREAWTVNHGDSLMTFAAAVTIPRSRRCFNNIIAGIIKAVLSVYKFTFTKEQLKRRTELRDKLDPAVEKALGSRVPELISLDALSTAPERQGLGYAGTLVNQLAVLADAQSRGIWLVTNLYTTGFYARFGFKVVGSVSLGVDNPTWEKGPVVLCIMLREPAESYMHNGEK
ncbi:hypothetical protein FOMPIDRAFT_84740 [Fomitopsis schrenkii]|uniref:N-acetyltransferase domain-containing protein n=1 Tax=Fomitopsis schrenkii TaxID=2126942 RepID=S8G1F6_FOMSC|nr:hypothetical protein FOMPIDRAFT_84740 [Fomitopsis schrenkii]